MTTEIMVLEPAEPVRCAKCPAPSTTTTFVYATSEGDVFEPRCEQHAQFWTDKLSVTLSVNLLPLMDTLRNLAKLMQPVTVTEEGHDDQ
jgi:hypothetical protein